MYNTHTIAETDFQSWLSVWEAHEEILNASYLITEDMLNRYDDNVVTPKGFRAQRLEKKRRHDGPHTRWARRGNRYQSWDAEGRILMATRITRFSTAEMHAEAAATLTPEARAEEEARRRPLYAECADFYYDTYLNPAAIAEHEFEEAQRYWSWDD